MTDKLVFGDAPTASLGIPRFDITLPETLLKGLGDFAQAVPVFSAAADRLRAAAEHPVTQAYYANVHTEEGWAVFEAQCNYCAHKWTAVCPESVTPDQLKCPACGIQKGEHDG